MSICQLTSFPINDKRIDQSINLENDVVSFIERYSKKTIFTMDPDCRTYYQGSDGNKLYIGKFSYADNGNIKFNFGADFLRANSSIQFNEIVFQTNDFIKAEEIFVYSLLNLPAKNKRLNYFCENISYFRDDFKTLMN